MNEGELKIKAQTLCLTKGEFFRRVMSRFVGMGGARSSGATRSFRRSAVGIAGRFLRGGILLEDVDNATCTIG